MQTTLPLSVGHPLRNVTGLAKQIALPGEHLPLRFPSFPALERTAVMGFSQPVTLELPASTAVPITLFRQACWPAWADRSVVVAYDVSYRSNYFTALAGLGTTNVTFDSQLSAWGVNSHARSGGTNGTAVSGATNMAFSYPLVGRDTACPGPEFVLIPAGCASMIAANVNVQATAPITLRLDFETWESPGQVKNGFGSTEPVNISILGGVYGGAVNIPATTANRWVRPVFCSVDNGAGGTGTIVTVSIAVATATDATYTASPTGSGTVGWNGVTLKTVHVPLVEPAEFANSTLPWYATRVTASALLGTNVSQVLNKGGTILGGRLSPAVVNAWDATQTYISNLHPAEKAYLPLETGVYTYCPPSTDLVFFTDYTLNTAFFDTTVRPCPLFSLTNDSMYNKMFLTASGVAETLAVTVSWHVEFRTSSALFQVGLSGMTLESLHAAQLALAESGFFFENPEHKSILNKIVANAKRMVPEVVTAVNPLAGKLVKAMIKSQPRTITAPKGPAKPPTTSAKASGMLGPQQGSKRKRGKKSKKA